MIEKIYCVSLKTETIRRNLMNEQLEKYFPNKYEIVDAIHYNDEIVTETYNNLTSKYTHVYALSQIAISLSHLKCVNEIYKNGYEWAAIIEDDIRIAENINEKIEQYITDIKLKKDVPTIIHLCGNPNLKQKMNKFVKTDPIVNTCFYIINLKYAELYIKSFFPIKYQIDTYLFFLNKNIEIEKYISVPLLSRDLSTTIYENWWSKEDKELHKKLTSLSSIKKIDKSQKKVTNDIVNIIKNNKCKNIHIDNEKWILKLTYENVDNTIELNLSSITSLN